jgi:hypothetical protein
VPAIDLSQRILGRNRTSLAPAIRASVKAAKKLKIVRDCATNRQSQRGPSAFAIPPIKVKLNAPQIIHKAGLTGDLRGCVYPSLQDLLVNSSSSLLSDNPPANGILPSLETGSSLSVVIGSGLSSIDP